MCYYIYGALFGNIDPDEYKSIEDNYEIKFRTGTKHDLKMCVQNENLPFRVNNGICDCNTELGEGNAESEEIKPYSHLFDDIRNLRGAKHIYLCKTWAGKRNKSEVKLKLNEINVSETLANIKENCLYVFEI